MKALSLFSNVGFGEYYLDSAGINVVVANELLQDRVDFYKQIKFVIPIVSGFVFVVRK